MATLFEGMWSGDVQALPVFKSEKMGVMAVLANPQETTGQLVVFPRRPVSIYEDLTAEESNAMDFALGGLAKHLRNRLHVDRVVRHIEGYGVPNHAHAVLLPSPERGVSDRIHHPSPRLPWEEFVERYASTQEYLSVSEEYIIAEADARRQAMIEDAT